MMKLKVWVLAMLAAAAVAEADLFAMPEIPLASARALGQTRGKAFRSGIVFINGKYIEPPYVVSRWGTGLRINGKPVSGQVIDWVEFLKTQQGVKVSKSEAAAPAVQESAGADEPQQEESSSSSNESDSSLDDLFDDDPKPKEKKAAPRKPVLRKSQVAKPKSTTTYSIDGEFVLNDASKVLVNRINAARTEIDRTLRSGGFICFGDKYQRVSGDSRTALRLLEKIPEMQRDATDARSFAAAVRAGGMVYFTDELCWDLYRNRIDYRKLMDRREQWKKSKQLENLLNDARTPLF